MAFVRRKILSRNLHIARRWFSTKEDKCPDGTLCKKKKKKPFWKRWFASEETVKPPIECCQVKFYDENKLHPDLSHFGGKAYRTCGRAYVIQKDIPDTSGYELPQEEKILKKIEVHPQLKELLEDPLPAFQSVEQRLIEISDRKLHPLYLKLRGTPKIPNLFAGKKDITQEDYKVVSGDIDPAEIPFTIKFNKDLLEKKNIYSEYKRVDPPRQLVGKMVEMKRNEKPTLESREAQKKLRDKEDVRLK